MKRRATNEQGLILMVILLILVIAAAAYLGFDRIQNLSR